MARVEAIHLNDSQQGLGSRVDRHAHIGDGQLGLAAFAWFVNDPRFRRVPMLLETPKARTSSPRPPCSSRPLTQINQLPLKGEEQIEVVIQNSSGAVIDRLTLRPASSPGIHPLESISFTAGDHTETYHIHCRLNRGSTILAESEETIHCLPKIDLEELKADDRVIIVREPAKLSGEEWSSVLNNASRGQPVIIGAMHPEDKVAQAVLNRSGITVELHPGYGSWIGCHHWLPRSGLPANLPSPGGLIGEAYSGILPRYILTELGGTVLAGSIPPDGNHTLMNS